MADQPSAGTIISGESLDAMKFDPVHWIVPGIIPEGQTLLVAPPKAGKSWLVYAVALARAAGTEVLGQAIEPGPVLYLALEDGYRRLQDRGRALLGEGGKLPAAIDYLIRLEQGTVIPTIEKWIGQHQGERPLVIIDTLGRIKPPARPGQSAYGHDYAVMVALKTLVDNEPGAGMILVHHDRKQESADFMDSVSGTNGIAGAADTTVVINRPRTEGEAVISVTGREVVEAEYAATFSAGHWALSGGTLAIAQQGVVTAKASANLGDRSADIVAAVGKAVGCSTISDVARATGVSEAIAKDYLGRLHRSKKLLKPKRGLYALTLSQASQVSQPTEGSVSVQMSVDGGTPIESDTSDGGDRRLEAVCSVCAYRLDPVLISLGDTTHPGCEPKPCGHTGKPLLPGKCGECIAEAGNAKRGAA